jgi:hypothetical protein
MYVAISSRACKEVVDDLIEQWNKISMRPYKAVTFTAFDREDNIIYHTDCMMTLLHDHAVISVDTVKDWWERNNLTLELCSPTMNNSPY